MCTCPVIHRHNTGGEKTGPSYSEEVTTSRPEEKWASLGEVPCVNVAGASEPRKVAHPFPRAELVYLREGEMPAQEQYPQGSSHLTRRDYLEGASEMSYVAQFAPECISGRKRQCWAP